MNFRKYLVHGIPNYSRIKKCFDIKRIVDIKISRKKRMSPSDFKTLVTEAKTFFFSSFDYSIYQSVLYEI